jgi:hypothetical protein
MRSGLMGVGTNLEPMLTQEADWTRECTFPRDRVICVFADLSVLLRP